MFTSKQSSRPLVAASITASLPSTCLRQTRLASKLVARHKAGVGLLKYSMSAPVALTHWAPMTSQGFHGHSPESSGHTRASQIAAGFKRTAVHMAMRQDMGGVSWLFSLCDLVRASCSRSTSRYLNAWPLPGLFQDPLHQEVLKTSQRLKIQTCSRVSVAKNHRNLMGNSAASLVSQLLQLDP